MTLKKISIITLILNSSFKENLASNSNNENPSEAFAITFEKIDPIIDLEGSMEICCEAKSNIEQNTILPNKVAPMYFIKENTIDFNQTNPEHFGEPDKRTEYFNNFKKVINDIISENKKEKEEHSKQIKTFHLLYEKKIETILAEEKKKNNELKNRIDTIILKQEEENNELKNRIKTIIAKQEEKNNAHEEKIRNINKEHEHKNLEHVQYIERLNIENLEKLRALLCENRELTSHVEKILDSKKSDEEKIKELEKQILLFERWQPFLLTGSLLGAGLTAHKLLRLIL